LDNPPADGTFRNQLNNLRNIPGALVTTYTYKPLVGITSKTDPNGITTYYEYDNFNRLIVIRDKDNKVLKKICYNYAGQPGACTFYANEEQSMSFQKNNCTNGNIGSNVTYTVPQGRYGSTISLSDANSKALTELSQNGQAYANANGTCSPPPTVTMTASHSTSITF
jgi:YD repeat-containing protein